MSAAVIAHILPIPIIGDSKRDHNPKIYAADDMGCRRMEHEEKVIDSGMAARLSINGLK